MSPGAGRRPRSDACGVRVLLVDGRVVPVVRAWETEHGVEFECTLGRRIPAARVVSFEEPGR